MKHSVHKLSYIKDNNFYFYCGNIKEVKHLEFVSGKHLYKLVTCKRCLAKIKKEKKI